MTESSQHTPEHSAHPHYQHAVQHVKDHRFITMIIGSIVVASFLVFVAMSLRSEERRVGKECRL